MNAKKETFGEREALKLAGTVNDIYAARGKKIVHVNVKKDKPSAADLKKVLLGPTGNLRAPTMRVGKTLLVGFNAETYATVFGLG